MGGEIKYYYTGTPWQNTVHLKLIMTLVIYLFLFITLDIRILEDRALPGYMDTAVFNVVLYFSTVATFQKCGYKPYRAYV